MQNSIFYNTKRAKSVKSKNKYYLKNKVNIILIHKYIYIKMIMILIAIKLCNIYYNINLDLVFFQ
jgi:hypothetical protein